MSEDSASSPFAFYAFYQLYAHFHNSADSKRRSFEAIHKQLYPNYVVKSSRTTEKTSLFITWKKKGEKHQDYNLRGCIGTFAKLPLLRGIEKYSLIAALQDHRFPPISQAELPTLKCSCNILHSFQTIFSGKKGDIFDWEVGVHGIELTFKEPTTGQVLSATFLPEVMPEQGWDKKDTFSNLIEKAGYWKDVDSLMDHYEDYFLEVVRYEGDKSQIEYKEFKRLMEL
ncbi:LANO_0H17458g1_1 [Lachancea nothofagi CBS 11611]|uniref:LANO_0H17458g1_1 n=1 Tax=Lachancea nothofagi CBS 11611 TaxID=1266666 RepID=A0A1G4KMW8_9SACH|nr:LANO_0H17458g1_1 [Lachancea nothofagi CBS 11611]